MSTSKINFRTIRALSNFITILADFVFYDMEADPELDLGFADGVGVRGLQERAADTGLLREISEDDWRALVEAALPEIQDQLDENEEAPDGADVRDLITGFSGSDLDSDDTGDRLIKHRVKQAAHQLRNLKDKVEQTTPQNVAERLNDHPNVGSGPYEGYWVDFVQEHSDEIMLELITDLEIEIEYVEDMLESEAAVSDSERKEEHLEELRNLLSTDIAKLDLSVSSHNTLNAADIKTIGELVQHEEDVLKFYNFSRKNIQELREVLDEHGLEFGMDVDSLLEDE